MNIIAFILGLFAFCLFAMEFLARTRGTTIAHYWVAGGLALTVAMLIVEFCATSHTIHF